jgi:S-adenosylmethionine:tRNA ribosyltransferase-isomerase
VSPLATAHFDYELPAHLIAQVPAERRDGSRLLVVDRRTRRWEHRHFSDLPAYLRSDDVLIRNTAAVLPARLHAMRPTGGAVECLLLRPQATAPADGEQWWCLLRPGRRLPVGATFADPGAFSAQVLAKQPDGTCLVGFTTTDGSSVTQVANRVGDMPLPPYIERRAGDAPQRENDLMRYQTVYADRARQVAVAAPTAGLHFTPELLAVLRQQGVQSADVILHVGLGTFRPITSPTVEEHEIHREWYEVPPTTQVAVTSPAGRRIAVGTTSVRSIEDFCASVRAPSDAPHLAEAGLFIRPPYTFRGVDALITNFHQPRSTLLCLVAAFLTPGSTEGITWWRTIYEEAIRHEYRFFSYGDAMLIV